MVGERRTEKLSSDMVMPFLLIKVVPIWMPALLGTIEDSRQGIEGGMLLLLFDHSIRTQ